MTAESYQNYLELSKCLSHSRRRQDFRLRAKLRRDEMAGLKASIFAKATMDKMADQGELRGENSFAF